MAILKCAVIGVGNGGGQVASLAKSEGFDAIAVNVSQEDTKTLKDVESFIIGNQMGSGKDRNLAKTYGKSAIEDLLAHERISKFINDQQVIFVCYTLGGGTGAGFGPMLTDVFSNVFSDPDESKRIRFVNVGILPTYSESIRAQQNTMDAASELTSYAIPYTFYDNERFVDMPMHLMMEKINRAVVDDMKVIRGDYNVLSSGTMIDPRDMLNVISYSGFFRIASAVNFQEKDLDKETVEDKLIRDLKTSAACEIDRDKIIKCWAHIVNIQPDIAGAYDSRMPKLREFVGEPAADFYHYKVADGNEDYLVNRVHVILSGLSFPDDRFKKIVQRIKEAEAQVTKSKTSSVLASYKAETGYVEAATDNKGAGRKNIKDIMNKY